MKRGLVFTLSLLALGFGFAAEPLYKTVKEPHSNTVLFNQSTAPAVKIIHPADKVAAKQSHLYLRLNIADPNPGNRRPLMPGLGLGYRKMSGNSALDFSAGYSQRIGSHHGKSEWITLPKMSYLYYLSPLKAQSVYVGPGIAYGRIRRDQGTRFQGLIPGASVGYEISRKANLLSFLQLDVNLPVIATKRRGHLPGLVAEFAFGAGF